MLIHRRLSAQIGRRFLTTDEITFPSHGNPSTVLSITSRDLNPLTPTSLHLKFLASPINPSDINQIQGIYPSKPTFRSDGTAVAGNEGVAEIISVGDVAARTRGFQVGDWVVPTHASFGTWRTFAEAEMDQVVSFDKRDVSVEQAAVISVNPSTAYRMLNDFVELTSGDWVIQNGANSAVGQAVIQLARERGLKTFNVVRKESFEKWEGELKGLGADEVVTDEAMKGKDVRELLSYLKPKLGLNCVGGRNATDVARALCDRGTLVTYGGMSMEPVSLPTSLFIFKDIRAVGYWQSRWSAQVSLNEKQNLLNVLAEKYREGVLDVPHGLVSHAWNQVEAQGVELITSPSSSGKQLIVF